MHSSASPSPHTTRYEQTNPSDPDATESISSIPVRVGREDPRQSDSTLSVTDPAGTVGELAVAPATGSTSDSGAVSFHETSKRASGSGASSSSSGTSSSSSNPGAQSSSEGTSSTDTHQSVANLVPNSGPVNTPAPASPVLVTEPETTPIDLDGPGEPGTVLPALNTGIGAAGARIDAAAGVFERLGANVSRRMSESDNLRNSAIVSGGPAFFSTVQIHQPPTRQEVNARKIEEQQRENRTLTKLYALSMLIGGSFIALGIAGLGEGIKILGRTGGAGLLAAGVMVLGGANYGMYRHSSATSEDSMQSAVPRASMP